MLQIQASFLPHKGNQCFSNSNYSLQPGERLSSDYGKRNKGERFFGLLNPIHFHNMVYGLFSQSVQISSPYYSPFPFIIFEGFTTTALGREAYQSYYDHMELRHRAAQNQICKHIGFPISSEDLQDLKSVCIQKHCHVCVALVSRHLCAFNKPMLSPEVLFAFAFNDSRSALTQWCLGPVK